MNKKTQHIGILTERMTLGYGVDLVIHEQAVRLIKAGYKVTVFPGWKTELYDNQPYKVVPLAEDHTQPVHYYSLDFLNRAFEIINRKKVDIWLIHTPPFYFWLTHLPSPVIMVEHGTPPGKYFKRREGKFLDQQTKKRQQKTFRSTRTGDGLVAISEYIKTGLPKDVQRNTKVIHNGGDHYPEAREKEINEFRTQFGISNDKTMILWVGRIQPDKDPQPYKGLMEFLRLAISMQKEDKNLVFVAAGRGDQVAEEKLNAQGIQTCMNVPRDKMPALYAAADLFVSTSVWEGFNLPLIEAQFQGTPVIAFDLCAHPEVVQNHYSGFLVQNIKEMKQKISFLAAHRDHRRDMAENAKLHGKQFTWDKNASELIRLINDCSALVEKGPEQRKAGLKKTPRYYLDYGQYLIQRFGWKIFLKECVGWFKRRV